MTLLQERHESDAEASTIPQCTPLPSVRCLSFISLSPQNVGSGMSLKIFTEVYVLEYEDIGLAYNERLGRWVGASTFKC